MKTFPLRLVLVLALLTVALFWAAYRFPGLPYVSDFAVNALFLVLGIAVIDRLLSRHEERQWSGAGALIDKELERLATDGLIEINNASLAAGSFSEYAVSEAPDRSIYAWAKALLQPGVAAAVTAATAKRRKEIMVRVGDIGTRVDRITMMCGPRLLPEDLESLLELNRLAASALFPFRAVPELGEANPPAEKQEALDELWRSINPAGSIARIAEELRRLGTRKEAIALRAR